MVDHNNKGLQRVFVVGLIAVAVLGGRDDEITVGHNAEDNISGDECVTEGSGVVAIGYFWGGCQEQCVCREGGVVECQTGDSCGQQASCVHNGRYECECNEGYVGDGYTCAERNCTLPNVPGWSVDNHFRTCTHECHCYAGGILDCQALEPCGRHAVCGPRTNYSCECGEYYYGDGITCQLKTCESKMLGNTLQPLEIEKNCHETCQCGYGGDLICSINQACPANARCDPKNDQQCVCIDNFYEATNSSVGLICLPFSCDSSGLIENGRAMSTNESVSSCVAECTCGNGGILECSRKECPENSSCSKASGYECVCDDGFRKVKSSEKNKHQTLCRCVGCEVVSDGETTVLKISDVQQNCSHECHCEADGSLSCNVKRGCPGNSYCNEGTNYDCRCYGNFEMIENACVLRKCHVPDSLIVGTSDVELHLNEQLEDCFKRCSCVFSGDVECTEKQSCHSNAHCGKDTDNECVCNIGYSGDGHSCERTSCALQSRGDSENVLEDRKTLETCREVCTCLSGTVHCVQKPICHENGHCSEATNFKCECDEYYAGSGYECRLKRCKNDDTTEPFGVMEPLEKVEDCDRNCTCLLGGKLQCTVKDKCIANAHCHIFTGHRCVCNSGFFGRLCLPIQCGQHERGNSYNLIAEETLDTCTEICVCRQDDSLQCEDKPPCGHNSHCNQETRHVCNCNHGYARNRRGNCLPQTCLNTSEKPPYKQFLDFGESFKNCTHRCNCDKDGVLACIPRPSCGLQAHCDEYTLHDCRCNKHHSGDGYICSAIQCNLSDLGSEMLHGFVLQNSWHRTCRNRCQCKSDGQFECHERNGCPADSHCDSESNFDCKCDVNFEMTTNDKCVLSTCSRRLFRNDAPFEPGDTEENCDEVCTCNLGGKTTCYVKDRCPRNSICNEGTSYLCRCHENYLFNAKERSCDRLRCQLPVIIFGDVETLGYKSWKENCDVKCFCDDNQVIKCVPKQKCPDGASCSEHTNYICTCPIGEELGENKSVCRHRKCEYVDRELETRYLHKGETMETCRAWCTCGGDGVLKCRTKPGCGENSFCDERTPQECLCDDGYVSVGRKCKLASSGCSIAKIGKGFPEMVEPGSVVSNCDYDCVCLPNRTLSCTRRPLCNAHGHCSSLTNYQCECDTFYSGNGFQCRRSSCPWTDEKGASVELALGNLTENCHRVCYCMASGYVNCSEKPRCSRFASCGVETEHNCKCNSSYVGNGLVCESKRCRWEDAALDGVTNDLDYGDVVEDCDKICKCNISRLVQCAPKQPCGSNATCGKQSQYRCVCDLYFASDGVNCVAMKCSSNGTEEGTNRPVGDLQPGDVAETCTQTCNCSSSGELRCDAKSCHANSICNDDRIDKCQCIDGYDLDDEGKCSKSRCVIKTANEQHIIKAHSSYANCTHTCSCHVSGRLDCLEKQLCSNNSHCDDISQLKCVCDDGYYGDGYSCSHRQCSLGNIRGELEGGIPPGQHVSVCGQNCICQMGGVFECSETTGCPSNARCGNDTGFECVCDAGFQLLGLHCKQRACSSVLFGGKLALNATEENCLHKCVCSEPGDLTCTPKEACDVEAHCDQDTNYQCVCDSNYMEVGKGSVRCAKKRCKLPNAIATLGDLQQGRTLETCDVRCECAYNGSLHCEAKDKCEVGSFCDDTTDNRCECLPGFLGNYKRGELVNCYVPDCAMVDENGNKDLLKSGAKRESCDFHCECTSGVLECNVKQCPTNYRCSSDTNYQCVCDGYYIEERGKCLLRQCYARELHVGQIQLLNPAEIVENCKVKCTCMYGGQLNCVEKPNCGNNSVCSYTTDYECRCVDNYKRSWNTCVPEFCLHSDGVGRAHKLRIGERKLSCEENCVCGIDNRVNCTERRKCNRNAHCGVHTGFECRCISGYEGTGYDCNVQRCAIDDDSTTDRFLLPGERVRRCNSECLCLLGGKFECVRRKNCGEHAHCDQRTNYDCVCDAYYIGDGYVCNEINCLHGSNFELGVQLNNCDRVCRCDEDGNLNCDAKAACQENAICNEAGNYTCRCQDGFYEDNEGHCVSVVCQMGNVHFKLGSSHENCTHRCQCQQFGEIHCEEKRTCSDHTVCDSDTNDKCVCNEYYHGDGYQCSLIPCDTKDNAYLKLNRRRLLLPQETIWSCNLLCTCTLGGAIHCRVADKCAENTICSNETDFQCICKRGFEFFDGKCEAIKCNSVFKSGHFLLPGDVEETCTIHCYCHLNGRSVCTTKPTCPERSSCNDGTNHRCVCDESHEKVSETGDKLKCEQPMCNVSRELSFSGYTLPGSDVHDCFKNCACKDGGRLKCRNRMACMANAHCNVSTGYECVCNADYQLIEHECWPLTCRHTTTEGKEIGLQINNSVRNCNSYCKCNAGGQVECSGGPACPANSRCNVTTNVCDCVDNYERSRDSERCLATRCRLPDIDAALWGVVKEGAGYSNCDRSCFCVQGGIWRCRENRCGTNFECFNKTCVCRPGHRVVGGNCQPIKCAIRVAGRQTEYLKLNEWTENCRKKCVCKLGAMLECSDKPICDINSKCSKDTNFTCVCNSGYSLSENECILKSCDVPKNHPIKGVLILGQKIENCNEECECKADGELSCQDKLPCADGGHCGVSTGYQCQCAEHFQPVRTGEKITCRPMTCHYIRDSVTTELEIDEMVNNCLEKCTCLKNGLLECHPKRECAATKVCSEETLYECQCPENNMDYGNGQCQPKRCDLTILGDFKADKGESYLEQNETMARCDEWCTCAYNGVLLCRKNSCHAHAECGSHTSHQCRCKPGHQGDGRSCAPVRCTWSLRRSKIELAIGERRENCAHNCVCGDDGSLNCINKPFCHENAHCDASTSFKCQCNRNYAGNGEECRLKSCSYLDLETDEVINIKMGDSVYNCQGRCRCKQDGILECGSKLKCGDHAHCSRLTGFTCVCDHGYHGDGISCEKISCPFYGNTTVKGQGEIDSTVETCREICKCDKGGSLNCAKKSRCISGSHCSHRTDNKCQCNFGYRFSDAKCLIKRCTVSGGDYEALQIQPGERTSNCSHVCKCKLGGDIECTPSAPCSEHAVCHRNTGYKCLCLTGHEGNGVDCRPVSCPLSQMEANLQGNILFGSELETCLKKCRCGPDRALACVGKPECPKHAVCGLATNYTCQCDPGYVKKNGECVNRFCPAEPVGVKLKVRQQIWNCSHECMCNPDGIIECTQVKCGRHSVCNANTGYRCECKFGYASRNDKPCTVKSCSIRDSDQTVLVEPGRQYESCLQKCTCDFGGISRCKRQNRCSPNAECTKGNDFKCECKSGYIGVDCAKITCNITLDHVNTQLVAGSRRVENCQRSCLCQTDGVTRCTAKPRCSHHGHCDEDTDHQCRCDAGFRGDGVNCRPVTCTTARGQVVAVGTSVGSCDEACTCTDRGSFECSSKRGCSRHASCGTETGFLCRCNEHFVGDGHSCSSNTCTAFVANITIEVKPGFEDKTCDKDCVCLPEGEMHCRKKSECPQHSTCSDKTGFDCLCNVHYQMINSTCALKHCQSLTHPDNVIPFGTVESDCNRTCDCGLAGLTCTEKPECPQNAFCDEASNYECTCRVNFYWDGQKCCPVQCDVTLLRGRVEGEILPGETVTSCGTDCQCLVSGSLSCHRNYVCSLHSECNEGTGYDCECMDGYFGDGRHCTPKVAKGNSNGTCTWTSHVNQYQLLLDREHASSCVAACKCEHGQLLCLERHCSEREHCSDETNFECECDRGYEKSNGVCSMAQCESQLGRSAKLLNFLHTEEDCDQVCTCHYNNTMKCVPKEACRENARCGNSTAYKWVCEPDYEMIDGVCQAICSCGTGCSSTLHPGSVIDVGSTEEDCDQHCQCMHGHELNCTAKAKCPKNTICNEETNHTCVCEQGSTLTGGTCSPLNCGSALFPGSPRLLVGRIEMDCFRVCVCNASGLVNCSKRSACPLNAYCNGATNYQCECEVGFQMARPGTKRQQCQKVTCKSSFSDGVREMTVGDIERSCSKVCTCQSNGTETCVDMACPRHAVCGWETGHECVCEVGFKWKNSECVEKVCHSKIPPFGKELALHERERTCAEMCVCESGGRLVCDYKGDCGLNGYCDVGTGFQCVCRAGFVTVDGDCAAVNCQSRLHDKERSVRVNGTDENCFEECTCQPSGEFRCVRKPECPRHSRCDKHSNSKCVCESGFIFSEGNCIEIKCYSKLNFNASMKLNESEENCNETCACMPDGSIDCRPKPPCPENARCDNTTLYRCQCPDQHDMYNNTCHRIATCRSKIRDDARRLHAFEMEEDCDESCTCGTDGTMECTLKSLCSVNETCNSNTGFECECKAGYRSKGNASSCLKITTCHRKLFANKPDLLSDTFEENCYEICRCTNQGELTCIAKSDCDVHGECGSHTGYRCVCSHGYTAYGDDYKCQPVTCRLDVNRRTETQLRVGATEVNCTHACECLANGTLGCVAKPACTEYGHCGPDTDYTCECSSGRRMIKGKCERIKCGHKLLGSMAQDIYVNETTESCSQSCVCNGSGSLDCTLKATCPTNAHCNRDTNFTCRCRDTYHMVNSSCVKTPVCKSELHVGDHVLEVGDVEEVCHTSCKCQLDTTMACVDKPPCPAHSKCSALTSYTCLCSEGYTMKGGECRKLVTCRSALFVTVKRMVVSDSEENCFERCVCDDGGSMECLAKRDCPDHSFCDRTTNYQCTCSYGYVMEGRECVLEKCSPIFDENQSTEVGGVLHNCKEKCTCKLGARWACTPMGECGENAHCGTDTGYSCQCDEGFRLSGQRCQPLQCRSTLRKRPENVPVNGRVADCETTCVCHAGGHLNCKPKEECGENGACGEDTNYKCECKLGYRLENGTCVLISVCKSKLTDEDKFVNDVEDSCEGVCVCRGSGNWECTQKGPVCKAHARCSAQTKYAWECDQGYSLKGGSCRRNCNCTVKTCRSKATNSTLHAGDEESTCVERCFCRRGGYLECMTKEPCPLNSHCSPTTNGTCVCDHGYRREDRMCLEIKCLSQRARNMGVMLRVNETEENCDEICTCQLGGSMGCNPRPPPDPYSFCSRATNYTFLCNHGYIRDGENCKPIVCRSVSNKTLTFSLNQTETTCAKSCTCGLDGRMHCTPSDCPHNGYCSEVADTCRCEAGYNLTAERKCEKVRCQTGVEDITTEVNGTVEYCNRTCICSLNGELDCTAEERCPENSVCDRDGLSCSCLSGFKRNGTRCEEVVCKSKRHILKQMQVGVSEAVCGEICSCKPTGDTECVREYTCSENSVCTDATDFKCACKPGYLQDSRSTCKQVTCRSRLFPDSHLTFNQTERNCMTHCTCQQNGTLTCGRADACLANAHCDETTNHLCVCADHHIAHGRECVHARSLCPSIVHAGQHVRVGRTEVTCAQVCTCREGGLRDCERKEVCLPPKICARHTNYTCVVADHSLALSTSAPTVELSVFLPAISMCVLSLVF